MKQNVGITQSTLPIEHDSGTSEIQNRILTIRGLPILLDRDLAELYGVPTKVLNQTVKRNTKRFPDGFMFQLTKDELSSLRSHFVTSNFGAVAKLHSAPGEHGQGCLCSKRTS